jgi:hypothetical protein
MTAAWEKQVEDCPDLSSIIEPGLDKLDSYRARMDSVPAYILAMGKCDRTANILHPRH